MLNKGQKPRQADMPGLRLLTEDRCTRSAIIDMKKLISIEFGSQVSSGLSFKVKTCLLFCLLSICLFDDFGL